MTLFWMACREPPWGPARNTIRGIAVPHIKSAKKRQRQTKVRTAHNKAQRSALRSAVKKVRTAGSRAEAEQALAAAETLVARAGRKNLIHRNVANRTKSRLAKLVHARTD